MPFGSRIVVNDIRANVDSMEIVPHPIYNIEQNWFSVKALQDIWHLDSARWPDVVDYADLQLQAQPHESITLVQIPSRRGGETLVFKSLVQDVKYMYHELKMLLTLKRHPNIIGAPLYVVTKKCRFGGKIGICGFILPFYPLGSLGKTLEESSREALSTPSMLRDRFRWARQIAQALLHIKDSPLGFYPDLKPDNVLLSPGTEGLDATLIDLEQRGGWYSWSPPEVRYIEYLEYIAARVECPPVRVKSLALLKSFIPGWKLPTQADRYRECTQGFSAAWLALEGKEREAAQVFMLGKLLWCIFEGTSSVNCGIGFDMFREQEASPPFPKFRDTPAKLRACIRACTAGAPEWDEQFRTIARRGTKYYAVERLSEPGELEGASPKETQEAAKRWWQEEVRSAKRFVEQKIRTRNSKDSKGPSEILARTEEQARQRPSLRIVLEQIEDAEIWLVNEV
ncbi:uncharacterized protein BDZ99DRAFT_462673 [Mytilinidion resinicola]|uniref:Protein kinase domain-containing protein n=1 Tax=Mytilinidion resinicola TaxID=574789 RepID=A0A6A6YMP1_9PEZI|nr:uncharacterized protein BDZ99DRAFT_462673 [Mytilinidion resinicola]KAF2810060.1 hypothetical protein BDZ99DRAFT_462673 [Mytilinidion resinicola]